MSAAPALTPPPPNTGAILGSQLVGTLLNFLFYWCPGCQAYIYHLSFPQDNVKIRYLVYFVVIFETVQTILSGIDAFNWAAKGFGNFSIIPSPGLSAIDTPFMDGVISIIVQLFFCYRIWVINKNAWWFSIFTAMVSLLQGTAAMYAGIKATIIGNLVEAAHEDAIPTYLWFAGGVIADILIAGAMSFLLLRARPTISRHSNDMISRIVRMVVETNAASATVAIISLGLYAGIPRTTYFVCPTMILGKIYSNTLLLTFNNRAFMTTARLPLHSSAMDAGYQSQTRGSNKMKFSAGLSLNGSETESDTTTLGQVSVIKHTTSDTAMGNAIVLDAKHSEWNRS